MTDFDFSQYVQSPATPFSQVVYTKTTWAGAWAAVNYLHCEEAAAGLLPAMSTATFRWRYGQIQQIGAALPAIYAKFATARQYVKVAFTTPGLTGVGTNTINWYGVIEADSDRIQGLSAAPTGLQTVSAYGTEFLLARHVIHNARWFQGGTSYTTDVPPDFNANGKPNRTANPVAGSYEFEADESVAQFWTSRDIIEYLLKWQTPADALGNIAVPFKLGNINGLTQATWDRPTITQANQTTLDVINQVVNRRNVLLAYWSVDDVTNEVKINTNTTTAVNIPISLPAAPAIPANNRQHTIKTAGDHQTELAVKTSSLQKYDQVICRGAKRRYVGTFNAADQLSYPNPLQSTYDNGASSDATYSATSLIEQRRMNSDFRRQAKFRDTYALFQLPASWDRNVGRSADAETAPLFSTDRPPFIGDMTFLPELPLLEGVDYSGASIPNDTVDETTGSGELMRPIVMVQNPTDSHWVDIINQGMTSDLAAEDQSKWSAHVDIVPDSRAVRVIVTGAPQHFLGGALFTAETADITPPQIDPTAGDVLFTLAVEGGQYCEGRWPANPPAGVDAIRKRIFDLGPNYTKDYVAPNTVLGVEDDGTTLVQSDGGWIPVASNQDNEAILTQLAKVLHAYYSVTRYVVQIETTWMIPPASLGLGDLITSVEPNTGHATTVNSFVSQIVIRNPETEGDGRTPPTYHLTTSTGETDAVPPAPFAPTSPPKAPPTSVTTAALSAATSHPSDSAQPRRGPMYLK